MKASNFSVYGFEGKGGRYLVLETYSASETRDLRDARTWSGFTTVVTSGDKELTLQELPHSRIWKTASASDDRPRLLTAAPATPS